MKPVTDYNGRSQMPTRDQQTRGAIPPWSGITAAYTLVFDIDRFMKGKRKIQYVTLASNYFPCQCSVCHKTIEKTEAHRAELTKAGAWIAHYVCAWSALLNHVYGPLYDRVMGR